MTDEGWSVSRPGPVSLSPLMTPLTPNIILRSTNHVTTDTHRFEHVVNSIHWIVWWTLICVYYCQSRKCSWYAAPFLPIIFPDEEPWSRDIGGGSAEVSARAPGHTRLLVTMEDVSPAPDIPGLWASRPGPAPPADDNNYCYKPIKDLFKDFFEQLLVLFIIISRAKRNHYSWKWCTLEAVFALKSLLSASNRKCMAIKSTVLEINVCIRQK